MTAVYGAGTITGADGRPRRMRATKAQLAARYDGLYAITREQQPTSIRFVFYRASHTGLSIPKSEGGYRMVQRALLTMRRQGRLPWGWIVDNTRWMRKPTTWDSLDEMLADAAASYRRALWHEAPTLVEVWCESESIAGVLLPITERWDVPLFPIKGQTSDTFAYNAAMSYRGDPRLVQVYYVGDHDAHGMEIATYLEAKLREHSDRDDIRFTHLACTADQIEEFNLPRSIEPKRDSYIDGRTGRRVRWHGPDVQVEALDPHHLRSELDWWIRRHVDQHRLRMLLAVEESERQFLSDWADRIAGGAA